MNDFIQVKCYIKYVQIVFLNYIYLLGEIMDSRIENSKFKPLVIILLLTIASFIMAININTFITYGDLFPGGFTGLTVLIQRIGAKYFSVSIPFSLINIPLNLSAAYLGFKYIGKKFTAYSLYVILLSSIFTDLLPKFAVTYDILLITLFGAVVQALGMGLCLRANACSGGTDFISLYLSEMRGIDAWNYIFAFNVCVYTVAGILFGFDKAMYSVIYQFAITQILMIINKRYQKHTMWIITEDPDDVYLAIHDTTNHGATLIKGKGFYQGKEQNLVYSVINSDEVNRLTKIILDIDPHAFINVTKTDNVYGNFYNRPKE